MGSPAPGSYSTGPVSDFGQPLAEWWKRLVAIIIDGIILFIPTFIISAILGVGAGVAGGLGSRNPVGAGTSFGLQMVASLIGVAINIAYYGYLNGSDKGQTVGKMVMKIQVRDAVVGGPIGLNRGVIRALLPGLAGLIPCAGFLVVLVDGLFPLWDPKRQALHDKIANTVVVDAPV